MFGCLCVPQDRQPLFDLASMLTAPEMKELADDGSRKLMEKLALQAALHCNTGYKVSRRSNMLRTHVNLGFMHDLEIQTRQSVPVLV